MSKFTVSLTYKVPIYITYSIDVDATDKTSAATIAEALVDNDEAGDGVRDTEYDESELVYTEVIPL